MNFRELHNQSHPLIIGNVWDAPSTRAAEKLNFQAIGTSSSAISNLLGYDDGEQMDFLELEYIVKRITSATKLPLSVDLESGYSRDPEVIAHHIQRMSKLGIVGINLEDSVVAQKRTLLNAQDFAHTIAEVKRIIEKENADVFLNIRTDTFILLNDDRIPETKSRIRLYENAGADGIFTPCITDIRDIEEIVNCTNLPINVMCMPNLPDFDTLAKAGVKRISMGNFLFDKMYNQFEATVADVMNQKSFRSIF